MTTFKIFLISLGLIYSFSTSAAPPLCIQNAAEHAEKNSSLPAFIRKLPAMLTASNFVAKAGLKIRAVGEKLKLEGMVWKFGKVLNDDCYITKACYDGTKLSVTLDTGKSYEATVKDDKNISLEGATFTESTLGTYNDMIKAIKEKESSGSSSSSGSQQGQQ